ncbi:hypothetical protein PIB30_119027 [Stylosanthes scabra]|uniref:Uncharacterized protein n=1 Tax=Stylosanthes scabra TaxID=79078 RepID=A0ABU6SPF7_9FABA|nr:hypothetical protein [Stylosanthes scabra]
MDLIKASNFTPSPLPFFTTTTKFSSHFCTFPCNIPIKPLVLRAKKRTSDSEPLLEPSLLQEVSFDEEEEEEDDELLDEFEFEAELDDDDDVIVDDGDDVDIGADEDEEEEEEEYEDGDAVVYVGDGGAGGGISLAGTWWDKKALAIAKEVTASFDGDLQIYAFKTLVNSTILVRIERLTNKSGSPTMEDIEAFSTTYRTKLDEAEIAKFVPENLSLEVPFQVTYWHFVLC